MPKPPFEKQEKGRSIMLRPLVMDPSKIRQPPRGIFLRVLLVHPLDCLGLGFGQVPPLLCVVYGVEEVDVGHVGAAEHHPVLVPAAHVVLVALGEMVPRLLWLLTLQDGPQIPTI